MSMMEKTKDCVKEVNEIREYCLTRCTLDMMMNMDGETLELMQRINNLMDTMTGMMVEAARIMDEQNRKLDVLVSRTKKR